MQIERVIAVLLDDVYDLRPWSGALSLFPDARAKIVRDRGFTSWTEYKRTLEKVNRIKSHCVEKMVRYIRSRLGSVCIYRRYKPPLFAGDTNFGNECDNVREKYNIFTPQIQLEVDGTTLPIHPNREFIKTFKVEHVRGETNFVIPRSVLDKIICITGLTVFTNDHTHSTFELRVVCNGCELVHIQENENKRSVDDGNYLQSDLYDGVAGIFGGPWIDQTEIQIVSSRPISSIIFTGWKSMNMEDERAAMRRHMFVPYYIPKPCSSVPLPPPEDVAHENLEIGHAIIMTAQEIRPGHTHEHGVCYNALLIDHDMAVIRYTS